MEHMLFKGTKKRKVREGAHTIESLGGTINAHTSYDQTVYHVSIASRYAEIGLDILSDAIQHSSFDPLEMEREREVILEEIRRLQDDPSRRLFQQTMTALYQQHPYKRPIIGTEETVRSIQRDQMVTFFKKWYVPDHMVFIAVGDFDMDEKEGTMKKAFKGFKPSPGRLPHRIQESEKREVRSIQKLTQNDLIEYYQHIVLPENMVFTVGADVDEKQVFLAVKNGFGDLKREPLLIPSISQEPPLEKKRQVELFKLKEQAHFILGFL